MRFSFKPLGLWLTTVVFAIGAISTSLPAQERARRTDSPEFVDGRAVARGEVLVRFRSETSGDLRLVEQLVSADENERLGGSGWRRLHSVSRSPAEIVRLLAGRPEIADVEPNLILRVVGTPNDPSMPLLWGLANPANNGADIHASGAWQVSTGTRAVVVGVVDTGIDYTHPDLAANVWSAPSPFTVAIGSQTISCPAGSHGFNALAFSCDPMDDHNHGTHVSGTIGAVGNNGAGVAGVNWASSIMGLKFLDSTGTGSVADAINAIEFAIQVKARFASTASANLRVLSNSWTGDGLSQSLAAAIERSRQADMLFVAAAGNDARNTDLAPVSPAGENVPNVLSVAASTNTDTLALFSNYGATSVDLGAPGVGILSTVRGGLYGYASGTSMATPHVAGAAALVLSACSLTTASLKQTLLSTVDQVAGLTGVVATAGRLNADRAIRSCAPVTAPTASANFIRTDTSTAGNWKGAYGSQGYAINESDSAYPPYAQVVTSSAASYTWAAATGDVRALQAPSAPGRIASTWYGDSFTFDLSLIDGASHQVALYSVDWDGGSRSQIVDVVDLASGVSLDSRTISSFYGGQYLVWNLTGNVRVRITRTGGVNAVVSALFFDPIGGGAGTSGTATFVGEDTASAGNWGGVYGSQGYSLANDASNPPSYVQLAPPNAPLYTWDPLTTDQRALQGVNQPQRHASTWYGDGFAFDLNVTDGLSHQVAFYVLDWDNGARVQQIDVVDPVNGGLLSTHTVSSFAGGKYLVWNIKGRVTLRIARLSGANAVVSGLFFD